jgi:hypothetical protein
MRIVSSGQPIWALRVCFGGMCQYDCDHKCLFYVCTSPKRALCNCFGRTCQYDCDCLSICVITCITCMCVSVCVCVMEWEAGIEGEKKQDLTSVSGDGFVSLEKRSKAEEKHGYLLPGLHAECILTQSHRNKMTHTCTLYIHVRKKQTTQITAGYQLRRPRRLCHWSAPHCRNGWRARCRLCDIWRQNFPAIFGC